MSTNEAAKRIRDDKPLGWTGQDWRAAVDEALAAAKAEGEREAVDRIRAAVTNRTWGTDEWDEDVETRILAILDEEAAR